jgi:hypothetical protein
MMDEVLKVLAELAMNRLRNSHWHSRLNSGFIHAHPTPSFIYSTTPLAKSQPFYTVLYNSNDTWMQESVQQFTTSTEGGSPAHQGTESMK